MIAGAKDKVLGKLPVPADARGERVLPTLRKAARREEKVIVAGVDIQRIKIRELHPFAINLQADVIRDLNAITAAKNCWKQYLRAEIAARGCSKEGGRGGDIVDREITVVRDLDRRTQSQRDALPSRRLPSQPNVAAESNAVAFELHRSIRFGQIDGRKKSPRVELPEG